MLPNQRPQEQKVTNAPILWYYGAKLMTANAKQSNTDSSYYLADKSLDGHRGSTLSDNDLVAQFVAGEQKAFNEIVSRYKMRIYSFIYFQIKQKQADAEDLTQDVFIAFYRQADHFRGDAKFSTFLFAISHNIVLNYFRANRRRFSDSTFSLSHFDDKASTSENADKALIAPDCPVDHTIKSNLSQKLSHAVSRLNNEERQLLLLTDREGFSYEQISHILSIKIGTVRSRLNKVRQQLLQFLKVNDHDL